MTTDPFESDLAARMGAATETVAAAGVTREGIAARVAARRSARRRRQGALVAVAAAALVALGAVAAVAAVDDDPTTEVADGGPTTTAEAPDPTTTEPCPAPTTATLPGADPTEADGPPRTMPCDDPSTTTTTEPPTTPPPTTPPATSTEPPLSTQVPPTTEPPPTTAVPPVTEAPPTTAPRATLASDTALAFVRGVFAGRDVSGLVDDGGFDPVADMRSELPEDVSGFAAQPVDFDWAAWTGGGSEPHDDDPPCADVGDGSVMCVIAVTRPDTSVQLHVYMTRDEPWRVRIVATEGA